MPVDTPRHRKMRAQNERASSPPPPSAPVTVEDLSGLNKADLKALAAERGLSVSGTKADIIARLEE